MRAVDFGIPQRRERVIIVGIRNDLSAKFEYPFPLLSETEWVPIREVVKNLAISEKKFYFSKRAVEGMKNAKNNMKRGLWQDLDLPCLTLTSHLAKVSLNSRDPVLLVDENQELYRRFTVSEAAALQSFPDNFIFPGPDAKSYKQIGNAVPPVLMWHIMNALAGTMLGDGYVIESEKSRITSSDDSDKGPIHLALSFRKQHPANCFLPALFC